MSAGLSNFPCPRCGASLDVDGSTLTPRCPYCGAETLVPIEIWTRLHPAPAAPSAQASPNADEDDPLGKKVTGWVLVAVVGGGILFVVGIGLFSVLTGLGIMIFGPDGPSKPNAIASVGETCNGRQAACSDDKKSDLVCGPNDTFVVGITCKGPGGCSVKPDGKTISCDYSLAGPGDPCDVDDGACAVDHKSELHCVGAKFVVTATCKGPNGCTISPAAGGKKTLSCDDHVADVGDPCFGSDRVACSSDGKSYLSCVGQKFAVEKKCTGPQGCKATHVAGSDKTEMDCDGPR
ncbi:MAG TPA: hypothetical protein VF407_12465 [Polyangiaceae bacterium]